MRSNWDLRLFAVCGLVILAMRAGGQPNTTEIISLSGTEDQGNDHSGHPSVSGDGRYVAFESTASNLVYSDSNGVSDVFLRDRAIGNTFRVSVAAPSGDANGPSISPSMSADGRHVAFEGTATNLVEPATQPRSHIFVRDLFTGQTELVSMSSGGVEGNAGSFSPRISPDGRFVVFESLATNLAADSTSGFRDIFIHDRLGGTTELVSVSSGGEQAAAESTNPTVSEDGWYVAFDSMASNLVPGDSNGVQDVFLRDRELGLTERVSVASDGGEANGASFSPVMALGGSRVVFVSRASDLVAGDTNGYADVFLRDRDAGVTERVSLSDGEAQGDRDSGVGGVAVDVTAHFIAFHSDATNLVVGDTNNLGDVFRRDLGKATTMRVSVSTAGAQGNGDSEAPASSANGRYTAFHSDASNLVEDDFNNRRDVFARELFAPYCYASGRIVFGDLSPDAFPPYEADFRIHYYGSLFGVVTGLLDWDGYYTIEVPAGPLILAVKKTHWLRQAVPADTTGGDAFDVDFFLRNGDCNDDNAVDLRDFIPVLMSFGQSVVDGDLNEDYIVDINDLNVLLVNFGHVGDP
jgi:Tol biopolymer transport system component